jgi:branched-subunit amino acid aminotransferase/4-amino-4-deoxychorismate lyase
MEIDGQRATAGQLGAAALAHYGHFTAMQVRDRRVRGLELHLARLDAANRELFGAGLDAREVRAHVRHALGGATRDASVRISVYETTGGTSMMVTVRPPAGMQATPWRLLPVPYQRPLAHIKHLGDFGQAHYQRLARRQGFDEALLTGPGGIISEGSVTNIGFFDGRHVVWPDAAALRGITLQILERALPRQGVSCRRAPVRLAGLGSFTAAFVTNSRGIAPAGQAGGRTLPVDGTLLRTLTRAYESAGWEDI